MSDDLTSDPRQMVQAVLKRDRRRMRTLAVLTIGLWVIATLLITSVYLPVGGRMKQYEKILLAADPNAVERRLTPREMERTPDPVPAEEVPATLARVRHAQRIQTEFMFHQWIAGGIILVFALGTGIVASVLTVALSVNVRRATLHQVSASLADISEQLRLLREQRPSC